ncbi:MAG: cyclic nucleotide-binding domain-containing protein [Deltaproteobacteria bacterium]|nr:cyclic nucleotide-binding domain-containing protein [Deltaproteobacteria bacterium]
MDMSVALGHNFLFRSLTPAQRELIARFVTPQWVKTGGVVFEQGAPGDAMYLIRSGELIVERDGTELARLEAGYHFGEMALIDGYPRSATIRAATQVELLELRRDAFIDALHKHPEIAAAVYRNFTWYLSKRLRKTSEVAAYYKDIVETPLELED